MRRRSPHPRFTTGVRGRAAEEVPAERAVGPGGALTVASGGRLSVTPRRGTPGQRWTVRQEERTGARKTIRPGARSEGQWTVHPGAQSTIRPGVRTGGRWMVRPEAPSVRQPTAATVGDGRAALRDARDTSSGAPSSPGGGSLNTVGGTARGRETGTGPGRPRRRGRYRCPGA